MLLLKSEEQAEEALAMPQRWQENMYSNDRERDPRLGGRKLGGKSSDQLLQRGDRHGAQIF